MMPYLGLGLLQSRTEWLPGEVGLGSSCPGKQKGVLLQGAYGSKWKPISWRLC